MTALNPHPLIPPGRLVPPATSASVQKGFVETFAPEMLPRLSPPYWGEKFASAALKSSDYLLSNEFQTGGRVLCLVSRTRIGGKMKFLRDIYLVDRRRLADYLTSLGHDAGCDFYVFDRSLEWFVAVIEERLFQMDQDGKFVLLCHQS